MFSALAEAPAPRSFVPPLAEASPFGGACIGCGTFTTSGAEPFAVPGPPWQCGPCFDVAWNITRDESGKVVRRELPTAVRQPSRATIDQLIRHGHECTVKHFRPSRIEQDELPVPESASPSAQLVARAILVVTNQKLKDGRSLHHTFESSALGRDLLTSTLADLGKSIDRKTVASALRELCDLGVLSRVGQMNVGEGSGPFAQASAWFDRHAVKHKTGSFLYRLRVSLRSIREVGNSALLSLQSLLDSDALIGGIKGGRRAEAALKWAIRNARTGIRNAVGYWLACRCKDAGLSRREAEPLIREYALSVDPAGHRYELREALMSLRSAYRPRA